MDEEAPMNRRLQSSECGSRDKRYWYLVALISLAKAGCRCNSGHPRITLQPGTPGLDGVTVVDEWDFTGVPNEEFIRPILLSMVLPVRQTPHLDFVVTMLLFDFGIHRSEAGDSFC